MIPNSAILQIIRLAPPITRTRSLYIIGQYVGYNWLLRGRHPLCLSIVFAPCIPKTEGIWRLHSDGWNFCPVQKKAERGWEISKKLSSTIRADCLYELKQDCNINLTSKCISSQIPQYTKAGNWRYDKKNSFSCTIRGVSSFFVRRPMKFLCWLCATAAESVKLKTIITGAACKLQVILEKPFVKLMFGKAQPHSDLGQSLLLHVWCIWIGDPPNLWVVFNCDEYVKEYNFLKNFHRRLFIITLRKVSLA